VPNGDTAGVIAQTALFTVSILGIGVLATLGYWLLKLPGKSSPFLPVVSCLVPIAIIAITRSFSFDCGASAATMTFLWLLFQLALLGWGLRRK
jgi:hypothetical protein